MARHNTCVQRGRERSHKDARETCFAASAATLCWATPATLIIAPLSCGSRLITTTACGLPAASLPPATSDGAPLPPRSSLALPLALAPAAHLGPTRWRRRERRADKIVVGSQRMRSTAARHGKTRPSPAMAIARRSSVVGSPLPLAIAAGSSCAPYPNPWREQLRTSAMAGKAPNAHV